MSKKSRRRNKKILAALALAGGAALMAKRGQGVAQGVSGADKAGFTSDAAYSLPKKNWITKKDVLPESEPVVTSPVVHGGGAIHHGKPKTLHLEKRARAHLPKGPPGWDNPYQAPVTWRTHTARGMNRAKGGRIGAKKGGRVTGIAKRGFGRALMKGKK